MALLFNRVHAYFFGSSGDEVKVGIIGLDNVGKNTLLRRITQGPIETISHPTVKIGPVVNYKTGQNVHLRMKYVMTYVGYDEPRGIKIWLADKFRDSDAIIFVVDDTETMEEAADWMEVYAMGWQVKRDYDLKVKEGIPWLVLGNKKVPDSKLTVEEIELRMKLSKLGIDWHVEVVNILTGEGVNKAMQWLRERLNTPINERLQMKQINP